MIVPIAVIDLKNYLIDSSRKEKKSNNNANHHLSLSTLSLVKSQKSPKSLEPVKTKE